VKLANHQEVVGRPALRRSREFGDDAAGNCPFAAELGAMSFAGQGHGREPDSLQARHPNILEGDAPKASPEFFRRVAKQGRCRSEREVFAPTPDGLLKDAHRQPGRDVHGSSGRRLRLTGDSALKVMPNEMQDFGSVHVRSSLS
jgi:hypothetical protein